MAIDLTGGLSDSREYLFASAPETEGMRDAVNMWVSDDCGRVSLPRIAVEAMMPNWSAHELQVNVGLSDGRIYRLREPYPSMPSVDDKGRATVLGAGPLVFRCVEPFRTWTAEFRGTAVETTVEALIAGEADGPRVGLEFELEATMAVPPWTQGTLFPEAAEMLAHSLEGKLIGGPRFEQLFRATGAVRVAGEDIGFTGSGLRIRRQGIRDITEFWGHVWQSALFPSGRGFGYIAYPPRRDGTTSYNEGYLYSGDGELIPAKVVVTPWMRTLEPRGQDVSCVLESANGITRIEGETIVGNYELGIAEYPQFPVLFQGGVRYRWDGEETFGMLERSTMRDQIDWS
jgi:hypothetical protein